MKQILLVAVTCVAMLLHTGAQSPAGADSVLIPYELYSWQDSDGSWRFSLLPSPSGVNIPREEILDKRFVLKDVKELKQKISGFPAGTTIFWVDGIMGTNREANEKPKITCPPPKTIQRIRRYAKARKIELEACGKNSD